MEFVEYGNYESGSMAMGITHDALKRAEKELVIRQESELFAPLTKLTNRYDSSQLILSDIMTEPYEQLKTNLLSMFGEESLKVFLIVGTGHGGGCSTTAIGLAASLASDSSLKVLLVDVNMRTPDFHKRFQIGLAEKDLDLSNAPSEKTENMKRIGYANLFIKTCFGIPVGPANLFKSSQFDEFLQYARKQFDYIILDGSPIPRFADSSLIVKKVDGVVLVVESGGTRRQVAVKAKNELEKAGARLLGIVLNKRIHFIPEWFYKLL